MVGHPVADEVKVVYVRFLHYQLTIFPFVISNLWETFGDGIHILFLIKLPHTGLSINLGFCFVFQVGVLCLYCVSSLLSM